METVSGAAGVTEGQSAPTELTPGGSGSAAPRDDVFDLPSFTLIHGMFRGVGPGCLCHSSSMRPNNRNNFMCDVIHDVQLPE